MRPPPPPVRRGHPPGGRPGPPGPGPARRRCGGGRAAPGRSRGRPPRRRRPPGAAPPRCRPARARRARRAVVARVTSATGRPASSSSSSRARVTPTRSAFIRVAPQAVHTAGRVGAAAPAGQACRRRRSATGPAHTSQRASSPQATHASSGARPLRLRTHTTRRSGPASRTQRRPGGTSRGPTRAARPGGRRPPRPASPPAPRSGTGPAAPPPAGQRLQRRVRRGEHARHPRPPGPLDGDVAGVPRRRPFLLVGLVALVEHEHRPQLGPGRPRAGPGPHGHAPAGRGRAQSRGSSATRTPCRRRRAARRRGGRQRRGQDEGVGPGGRLQGEGQEVARPAACGRRPPRPGEGLGREEPRRAAPTAGRRLGRRRQAPHRARRRRRLEERRAAAGPPPGGPPGQVDQVGRRPPPGDLGQRLQRPAGLEGGGVGLVRQRHHPAADAAAGQRDPHHGAHPHVGLHAPAAPGSRTSWRCRPRPAATRAITRRRLTRATAA